MTKRVVLAPLALLAMSTAYVAPAHAQQESTFYAGAGVGQVSVTIDGTIFDESNTGFKALGGVLFNPYFGMEAAYWLGAKTELSEGSSRAELSPTVFTAQGIGRYAFGEWIAVYGKLGVAFYRFDVDVRIPGFVYDNHESGSELVYGVGASGRVWGNIEARLEWEQFAFGIDDADGDTSMVSLSGVYKF